MSTLQTLGIVDISDADTLGTICMKLADDLLLSVKNSDETAVSLDKARNIITICCEYMYNDLIDYYGWSPQEIAYADDLIRKYTEVESIYLLNIPYTRVKHTRMQKYGCSIAIEDRTLVQMMACLIDTPNRVRRKVKFTFVEKHGSMNFQH